MSSNLNAPKASLFVCSTVASLGGFLFGFDTGVIAGALPYIRQDEIFPADDPVYSSWVQGTIVSSTLIGGALGSVVFGMAADMYGRHRILVLTDGIFVLGGILMCFAGSCLELILGRFIVGLAIGASAVIVPVFISENAPAHVRGEFVSMNTVYVTLGQVVAYGVNVVCSYMRGTWRVMLGLSIIPACIQAIGLVYIVPTHEKTSRISYPNMGMWKSLHLVLERPVWDQVKLGVGLQMLQQLAGINTVMYFLPIILESAGVVSIQTSLKLSMIPAGCNVLGTLIGKRTIDHHGRRRVLLTSLCGVAVALLGMSAAFTLSSRTSPLVDPALGASTCPSAPKTCSACISSGCIFCMDSSSSIDGTCVSRKHHGQEMFNATALCASSLDRDHITAFEHACPTAFAYSTSIFILTCVYLLAFSPGLGPVPWILCSEIFRQDVRALGMGIASFFNWMTNFIVCQVFLTSVVVFGANGTFFTIFLIVCVGFWWVYRHVPETKGKDFDEIQAMFFTPPQDPE